VLFLDYESPNSSDMRIPRKDVLAYQKWSEGKPRVPYVIVTTLPDKEVAVQDWELLWTAEGQVNAEFHGRKKEVCRNPFGFWYNKYREALRQKDGSNIYFININGKVVSNVTSCIWSGR